MQIRDSLRRLKSNIVYPLWEKRNPGNYMSFRAFDYYKAVFIHIPKAAGTSINKTLFGNIGAAHTKLTHFERIYAPDTFASYFKFTFVRNPYDRIFSAYNYLSRGGGKGNERDFKFYKENLTHIRSFEEFVLDYLNEKTRYAYMHLEPQVDFIRKIDGALGVDFIGRYESINKDFSFVANKLGIKRELRHENPTGDQKLSFIDFYTPESKEKIYALYHDDFRLLNYER